MTIGSKTALTVSLVGALAIGIWAGNKIVNDQMARDTAAAPVATAAPAEPVAPAPRPRVVRHRARAAEAVAMTASADARDEEVTLAAIAVTSPDLHAILKPVLNRGANLSIAGEGFRDGQQFATIAHAARNTAVPFMLLKHRVLDEGKSLADAIRESKPDIDAKTEAERAKAQAQDDLAAIASN